MTKSPRPGWARTPPESSKGPDAGAGEVAFVLRPVPPGETLPLRQRVLRPHQPRYRCVFPGDELPEALHVGAFLGGTTDAFAVASIFPERDPRGEAPEADWRIRGMAVVVDRRRTGVGRALVQALLNHAAARRGKAVWCNARTPVSGFYERLGFRRAGPAFDLPGIGPHVVMTRGIGAAG
ncbi:MAG TPA: GNAT family N-acetyltransferase [Polyangiaceae bacterium LLY-WYZ-14_1]|nr:GNAT family N-acetyltransferase [Polyangiaceae bacterium LLY-WYZ-14_1]